MNVDRPVESKEGKEEKQGMMQEKQEPQQSTGKSEAKDKDLDFGEKRDSDTKMVELCDKKFPEDYLEKKDWNCVLHINNNCTSLLFLI